MPKTAFPAKRDHPCRTGQKIADTKPIKSTTCRPENRRFDPELHSYFGVGRSTASEKAKRIQESLKIYGYDPRWTLASRLADNPTVWQIMVKGLVIDAREAPREIQEEAVRRGLIPYLPGPETDGVDCPTKTVHEFFDHTGFWGLGKGWLGARGTVWEKNHARRVRLKATACIIETVEESKKLIPSKLSRCDWYKQSVWSTGL